MDRIIQNILGVSSPRQQYLLSWMMSYSKEIKLTSFIFFAFIAAALIQVNNKKLIDIVGLYKIKVETPSELYSAPLVKVKNKNKVKVNV